MEVHHHSHTARKKWTHYFWEFLMLFLAVFCGFLAEYQLEHVIEHQREKQFMKSMVEDLEKDITLLNTEAKQVEQQYQALDSLTGIIYEGNFDQTSINKMYEIQRRFLTPVQMRFINRTELQLKNAGGMRLVRNRKAADSLIIYWSRTELLYEQQDNINGHRIKAKDVSFTIFNNKYYNDTGDFSRGIFNGVPELMTRSNPVLSEFANRISHMNALLKFSYARGLKRQTEDASRLISLIKREYNFK
jgi:hypothetical protein